MHRVVLSPRALWAALVAEALWAALVVWVTLEPYGEDGFTGLPWKVEVTTAMQFWSGPAIAIAVVAWLVDRAAR